MSKQFKKGPLPTFFVASVFEARSSTYANAGYTLARGLRMEVDDESTVDEALAAEDPVAAIWDLVKHEMPRCAALVPSRRRASFLMGIERAMDQGHLDA